MYVYCTFASFCTVFFISHHHVCLAVLTHDFVLYMLLELLWSSIAHAVVCTPKCYITVQKLGIGFKGSITDFWMNCERLWHCSFWLQFQSINNLKQHEIWKFIIHDQAYSLWLTTVNTHHACGKQNKSCSDRKIKNTIPNTTRPASWLEPAPLPHDKKNFHCFIAVKCSDGLWNK